jgi:ribosomal-protein-alanine N-acetyltransferase
MFITSSTLDNEAILAGKGVRLRYPRNDDYESWSRLREDSRSFLAPWEPTWPEDDLTRHAYRRRIKRYHRDIREDAAYPFFVFRETDGALVGGATLSNIRRGVTLAATLGYWVGAPYQRQGLMTAAVRTIIPFVFNTLRLHRIEAACLPENEASQRLLLRVGFSREGYARSYLRINGAWRDHVLFAMLESDPRI